MGSSKDKKDLSSVNNAEVKASSKKTTVKKSKASSAPATTISEAPGRLMAGAMPTADALKERFKAGSIPLQSDFADLIDMANTGAKAAGKAAGQTGPGKGMRLSSSGQLEPDIGAFNFKDDSHGCSPVLVNTDTNQIVVDLDNGLIEGNSGISVKAGNGIIVDSDGVKLDPINIIPKGLISMYSGSTVPAGWALCNGENGTPDLRDRFVLSSSLENINKFNKTVFSGDITEKVVSLNSSAEKPGSGVTVEGHTLTISELPSHGHDIVNSSRKYLQEGAKVSGGSDDHWPPLFDVGHSKIVTTES